MYITNEDVEIRLIGKVRFTDSMEDENKMPRKLLARLINEAEGKVEYDLSPRYSVPFVNDAGQPFAMLPERPTRNILRTLCEIQSVILVLETDFGRGSVVDADKYAGAFGRRYKKMVEELLGMKGFQGSANAGLGYAKPPLPGLQLNYMNSAADDGFQGMVMNTTTSPQSGLYASWHINDPGSNFWNAAWL